jgi:hypothetical protein
VRKPTLALASWGGLAIAQMVKNNLDIFCILFSAVPASENVLMR